MPIVVAEYLGVRTDTGIPIQPIKVSKDRSNSSKPELPCPFRNGICSKAKRGDKPVCSLRDSKTNELWIVCEHRFCATSPKEAPLNEYQVNTLTSIAKTIYHPDIQAADVLVKREVEITVTEDSNYKADYVMWRKNHSTGTSLNLASPIILEMQGGGETTNTGDLTAHIHEWDSKGTPDNAYLLKPISKVAPLVTNAWRRQQEQFLVKGNVAMLTGGRMVFCVGTMIYDYLMQRFREGSLQNLRNANWTLAFIAICEDSSNPTPVSCAPHSIPLKIDTSRMQFTNYQSFVQGLINQSAPSASVFTGTYTNLLGEKVVIPSS